MHYPWWYVPHITAPMLIACISVVHVLVSHYAVGGGFFLAVETAYAYRTQNRAYLEYLHRHARFFVLLTVVFGAITGVGIWWTIGLASPLATEVLIKTFVFGWAIEYVFFLVEIASAFIFYYYWGRLPEKTHVLIGWIYALSAWASLLLITGITAFMLNPAGLFVDWAETHSFWAAFFNVQLLPQTVARTGGALLLSSLYVYLHASLLVNDNQLRDMIGYRSTRPALLGAVLVTLGGVGWYFFLPESAKLVLSSAAPLNILMALIFALTVVVFVLLYYGPYRNPGWLTTGFAAALFLFGTAAFSTGEFVREAVRKPYIIYNVVLGNQIRTDEVATLRRQGFLEGGWWTKMFVKDYVQRRYPGQVPTVFPGGRIDQRRLLTLPGPGQPTPRADRVALGEVLFMYHCNDCHAAQEGYSAVAPLIRGWTPPMVQSMVLRLHRTHFFMPPWSGTPQEAELLRDYLLQIQPPWPLGMHPEWSELEAE